jgi:hypothetical protein
MGESSGAEQWNRTVEVSRTGRRRVVGRGADDCRRWFEMGVTYV